MGKDRLELERVMDLGRTWGSENRNLGNRRRSAGRRRRRNAPSARVSLFPQKTLGMGTNGGAADQVDRTACPAHNIDETRITRRCFASSTQTWGFLGLQSCKTPRCGGKVHESVKHTESCIRKTPPKEIWARVGGDSIGSIGSVVSGQG